MDSVIPADVLEHLRSLSERSALDGLFTTKQLAEQMGCGEEKARRMIRPLIKDGKVRARRVSITDQDADELGYLGGTSIRCYEWVDAA